MTIAVFPVWNGLAVGPGSSSRAAVSVPWDTDIRSGQRFTADGGPARVPTYRPGGRGGLERGLDGVGDERRDLGIDGDVVAEQHAAARRMEV